MDPKIRGGSVGGATTDGRTATNKQVQHCKSNHHAVAVATGTVQAETPFDAVHLRSCCIVLVMPVVLVSSWIHRGVRTESCTSQWCWKGGGCCILGGVAPVPPSWWSSLRRTTVPRSRWELGQPSLLLPAGILLGVRTATGSDQRELCIDGSASRRGNSRTHGGNASWHHQCHARL